MSSQTGSYSFKAAKDAHDDAATKATNFLSVDESGIMVYDGSEGEQLPSTVSSDTRNVFIDPDSLNIRIGQNDRAKFASGKISMLEENSEMFILDNDGGEAQKRVLLKEAKLTSLSSSSSYTCYWQDLTDEKLVVSVIYHSNRNGRSVSPVYKNSYSSTSATSQNNSTTKTVNYWPSSTSSRTATIKFYWDYVKYSSYSSYSFRYTISNMSSSYMGDITVYFYREYTASDAPYLCFGSRNTDEKKGGYSSSFGIDLTVKNAYETVVGKYNKTTDDNNLFVVGNGSSSSSRSNAFEVDSSGYAYDGFGMTMPFVAIVGTTTYSQVLAAYNHNRMIFAKYNDSMFVLMSYEPTLASPTFNFIRIRANIGIASPILLKLNSDDGWITSVNQNISLGSYVATGFLTSSAGTLTFTIPTGRIIPTAATVNWFSCNMVSRAGNANGTGQYITRGNNATPSSATVLHTGVDFDFYNMANAHKVLSKSKITMSLQGCTNLLFSLASGVDHYFSNNSTNTGYINNQPVAVYCSSMLLNITAPIA